MENNNLTIIEYEWKNNILTVCENEFTHNKLQNDPRFATRYFEKFLKPTAAKSRDETSVEQTITSDEDTPDENIWSKRSIKLLLSEYKSRIHRFNNPLIKKSILWNEIAKVFRSKNIHYPVRIISRKFFNMKTTYYKIKNHKPRIKMARKPWPWIEAMEEVLKYDESINFTSYAIGNKNIQDESLLKEKSQQKTSSIINNTNNNNNNDINTIEIKSKFEPDQSSNNKIITPRNSENEFKSNEDIVKDDDNWDTVDDTSNFSSSSGVHSNSNKNLSKENPEYTQKLIDLKSEEVEILKRIHKDIDDSHYSKIEVISQLTNVIKEHTAILKELTDALKQRFIDK
ncbi:putative mediator of RNA polymerase II transcription subunit 24 [Microplitis demolitor]|uniref:putative mediator of RNA polymerase II transcription subunit 24 n=1 Tax=Microplitis demolitor TaxID=69319 RepID=UPI0004CCEA12|nr:putative mediator of RNA polymerase II transcription subunit 24 [Microplitis demolitor]